MLFSRIDPNLTLKSRSLNPACAGETDEGNLELTNGADLQDFVEAAGRRIFFDLGFIGETMDVLFMDDPKNKSTAIIKLSRIYVKTLFYYFG